MNQLTTENAKYHGHPSASWINDIGWMDGCLDSSIDCLLEETHHFGYPSLKLTASSFLKIGRPGPKSFRRETLSFRECAPWKINMEPTNQPFRKENDLPNLHDYVPS